MGSCLCKSSKDLTKTHLNYPMNDLSSVFKDGHSVKNIKNEKYIKKETNKHGDGQS